MDLSRDLFPIVILVVCFAVAVVLAAAEIALIRVPRVRIETMVEDNKRARRLLGLLDDLPLVLNTILLTVLLVQLGAATVTGILAERWFGNLGIAIATAVLTLVLFVYSEAIPKTYAFHHPTKVALALVLPVAWLLWLLHPIVRGLVWFADLHARGEGMATTPTVTERELRRLAADAVREGEITGEDHMLLERAFVVGDRVAEDVMIPRVDVVSVDQDVSVQDALEVALRSGHRRIVVRGTDLDDIVGVARIRDLVGADDLAFRVGGIARSPLFVTRWTAIVELLREMQARASHFAVVVDEHGGTAGIVTIEDIVEELVGTLADEDAEPTPEIIQSGGRRWLVDGGVLDEDLASLLGTKLPEGDWTTAAGLVLGLMGRVPDEGDVVEAAGWSFRVVSMRGRRISLIEVAGSDETSSA